MEKRRVILEVVMIVRITNMRMNALGRVVLCAALLGSVGAANIGPGVNLASSASAADDSIWLQAYPKLDARSLVWWFGKIYGPGDYASVLVPPGEPLLKDRQLKGRPVYRDELAAMFAIVLENKGIIPQERVYVPDIILSQKWLMPAVQYMADVGVYHVYKDGNYRPNEKVTPNEIRAWRYRLSEYLSSYDNE